MVVGAVSQALSRRGVHLRTVAHGMTRSALMPFGWRAAVLRALSHDVSPDARIAAGVVVTGARLSIGAGSYVNLGCLLDATGELRLGERVHVGHRSMLLTSTHAVGGPAQRAGENETRPVRIDDGAWLGAGVILLPGAEVGAGAIVAAGAVVAGICEPHGLYAGVPAKLVRMVDPGSGVPGQRSS